jgi:DNA-binding NarL/FixJ family response regulator
VAKILIYSNNPQLTAHWTHALIGDNSVSMLSNINSEFTADAVLIDARKLDEDESLFGVFTRNHNRFLVIGSDWPESKQIEVLVMGAAGYCDESEPPDLLIRAIESILKGDIWIRRSLVPKVIAALSRGRQHKADKLKSEDLESMVKLLESLSAREMEVAEMIQIGESNKRIALVMNISERTVKAHLSSIFRKLSVDDRLHLAIFLKEIEQYRKTTS